MWQNTVQLDRPQLAIWLLCPWNICKLCGWFGNRWRVSDGRDLGPFTPLVPSHFLSLSLSVLSARPWGLESFYPGSSLAFWPRELLRGRDVSKTLAIWTHTRLERKCIAGLLITNYCLLFVLIQQPGLATPIFPWNRLEFVFLVIYWVCNLLWFLCISFYFILFYFILLPSCIHLYI